MSPTTSQSVMSTTVNTTAISWPILFCSDPEETREALEDLPFIQMHIIRGCRRLLDKGVTTDICLEIITLSTSATIMISFRLDECHNLLQRILEDRIAAEDYEVCGELVRLQEEVRVAEGKRALESPKLDV